MHIGKQRNLPTLSFRNHAVGAANQNVRLNAYGAQFLDRMLGGLGFKLARTGNIRNKGQVDKQGFVFPLFHPHLAYGFHERL